MAKDISSHFLKTLYFLKTLCGQLIPRFHSFTLLPSESLLYCWQSSTSASQLCECKAVQCSLSLFSPPVLITLNYMQRASTDSLTDGGGGGASVNFDPATLEWVNTLYFLMLYLMTKHFTRQQEPNNNLQCVNYPFSGAAILLFLWPHMPSSVPSFSMSVSTAFCLK